MAKFRCKNCNYQFARELDMPPKSCPNCGQIEVLRREQSASELLDDSE